MAVKMGRREGSYVAGPVTTARHDGSRIAGFIIRPGLTSKHGTHVRLAAGFGKGLLTALQPKNCNSTI